MSMGTVLRYYIATSALAYLISSTYGSEEQSASTSTPTTTDTVDIQLKTEELQAVKSDLVSLNSSNYRPFQCVVKGLTEETLERLKSREDTVLVTVNGDEYASSFDNQSAEDIGIINGTQAVNVHFHIENDTVFINGSLRENETNFDIKADNNRTNICELSFHKEEVIGESPKILTSYNHVVLMNGAPDQVISCTATGKPTPRVSWGNSKQNLEGSIALTSESIYSQPQNTRTSYLLFSEVNLKTSDNYTCTAENDFGTTSKTFEVEVISVEALNSRCNAVLDEARDTSSSNSQNNVAIIFNQDISKVLSRSKRHLWYQWRGTKYYIPPVRRPRPPPTPDHNVEIHTNLQKMVNFITERLKLADKVAVNKWDNNLPVEDVPREQIILDNMVRQAENGNVDPRWAHQFFRDQIEANKDIQFDLIRTWQLQGRRPDGPPVDLTNEVRPQIDIINAELIQLAKKTEYERREWKCRSEVERNARYATFLYDLDPLHQRALQKATSRLCITSRNNPSNYPF